MKGLTTVATDLLEAMAGCCSLGDASRWTSAVIFDRNELFACSGHILVRVAMEELAHGRFAIGRTHLLAAIGAQDVYCAQDIEPTYDMYTGEVEQRSKRSRFDRGGSRTISILPEADKRNAVLTIGLGLAVRVPLFDVSKVISMESIESVSTVPAAAAPAPDGIGLDPRLLARIHNVGRFASGTTGIRVVGWSDTRSPVKFQAGPMTAVVMPMRIAGGEECVA